MKVFRLAALLFLLSSSFLHVTTLAAQESTALFGALKWRNIGPYRGGRVTAVAGVEKDRLVYYMGATGGGVWKTSNGGITWTPISDGFFKTGSVGAIAVAQSNPNIVYVGMGEACLRANISHGDGVYKSMDAGKTWTNIGLRDTSQIGKVRVDPNNPDIVYVAAVGHPYGPNKERGVFRSRDGGKTWKSILSINEKTGAADLSMDPQNPLTIYATTWQVLRTPSGIQSTGPGSGIYKTTDGGDNWTKLEAGLPKGDMGKIGITVSAVDHNRVWATVEAADGGIYRSDDAGAHWKLLNSDFDVRSRQYYYGHIFADPQELDTVYTFSSKNFLKSTDGGVTYKPLHTPHGDYHDLWIDPHDHQRMVDGDDGGATVTSDGGESWTTDMNQSTAQFYTVRTDNTFPYHVFGSQQDNTTVGIASRTNKLGIDATDWYEVGGGESGYVIPDLKDSNIIYAGAFWGLLTRYDQTDGSIRNISIWPDLPGGRTAAEQKDRFPWTYPIATSPADPDAIYAGGNTVFKSINQGQSWTEISPDLTRNDKSRETERLEDIYATVFTIAPSPLDKRVIWAGSDDGLIHVTRDGGKSWVNVTPPEIKPWAKINVIEASPHDPATAYAAVNRYQLDDFAPYLYRTHDFGKTWKLVANGITSNTFVRSVREDIVRKGLLYAATETGVYVSFNDGDDWKSLQLNLPIVPITDLTIKDADLVISTQGRSFWILDNISPLRQIATAASSANSQFQLFKPEPAYRLQRSRGGVGMHQAEGQNPDGGLIVDYYLHEKPLAPITLTILDPAGKQIRSFSSTDRGMNRSARNSNIDSLTTNPNLNRFVWNLRYPAANPIEGKTYLLMGTLDGPQAIPGEYKVVLTVGDQSQTQSFEIRKNPRLTTSPTDFKKQLEFSLSVRDKLSETDDAINQIQKVRKQLKTILEDAKSDQPLVESGKEFDAQLDVILNELYEPRFTGYDDQTLIFPLKLNNRIASMQRYVQGDYAPTDQDYEVFKLLSNELDQHLAALKELLNKSLPQFSGRLNAKGFSPVDPALGQ
jgi:photosystem II stability/assembly factor-like uncharacterized protein